MVITHGANFSSIDFEVVAAVPILLGDTFRQNPPGGPLPVPNSLMNPPPAFSDLTVKSCFAPALPLAADWTLVSRKNHTPKRNHQWIRSAHWAQHDSTLDHEINADIDPRDSRRDQDYVDAQHEYAAGDRIANGRLVGQQPSRKTRGRRGFVFDSTCGYPGEGPSSNQPGEWHTKGPVKLADIRKSFPAGDHALITEAQRLINDGHSSSEKLTVEQLTFLRSIWKVTLGTKKPKVCKAGSTPTTTSTSDKAPPQPKKKSLPTQKPSSPALGTGKKATQPQTPSPKLKKPAEAAPVSGTIEPETKEPWKGWNYDYNGEKGAADKKRAEKEHEQRKRAEVERVKAHLKSLEGPGAAKTADAIDPALFPAIPPIGDEEVRPPQPHPLAASILQSEKDAETHDLILSEIVTIIHTKFQFANIKNQVDCNSVLKTVHAWAKTRDFPRVIFDLRAHEQRMHALLTDEQRQGRCWQQSLWTDAHVVIEQLFDRELHKFATSNRRIQPAAYSEGDGFTSTTIFGFTARGPIQATIADGLCGRPNRNLYVKTDELTNKPVSDASEVARNTTPLSYRSPQGVPEWKIRLADSVSRSGFASAVGLAEEGGKRLLSSAAVKVAIAVCPLAHVAAAAGIAGYLVGSAALSRYETWRQPGGLSFGSRFLGHSVTSLTGHAGTLAHMVYNGVVGAIGRPELALNSVHASRSQPTECLAGIVKPAELNKNSTLTLGTEPCRETFGVQRLVQVGTYTQAVPRQCVCNSEIALTHRVLRTLPMHSQLVEVEQAWKGVADVANHIAKKVGFGEAMNFYTWLNRYAGNKKRMFAALRHERPPMVHTTKAKVFIKAEKYPRSIEGAKNSPPRVISGCPEELTYHTGRWLTSAAKRAAVNLQVPDGPGGGGRIYYTCGYNADEIGDLLREAIGHIVVKPGDRLVFLEDDQSKFDQHIGKSAFKTLDAVYRHILPKNVRKLLKRGKSRGGMRNGTRFTVDYTMQSGYPDTSFGDTILNAIMKTSIHLKGGNWSSLICGDDSVTVTTQSEIDRLGGIPGIVAAYTRFGMEIEASVGTNVLDIGYCSGRFLPQFDTFVLVPKTGKILSKAFWSTREYNDLNLRAWANGVCQSLDTIGERDPIIAAVSKHVREQTKTRKVRLDVVAGGAYSVVYKSLKQEVDHDSIYYAYSHWYNIFSDDVQHLVCNVANKFDLDAIVQDPLLESMVRLDTPSG